jgi:hypothetical protein
MERSIRLQLVARATYYLGWIAMILATLMDVAKISRLLTQSSRNVLEASFLLFVICIASGIGTVTWANDNLVLTKKQVA